MKIETEVVYVCSPDFRRYVMLSLRTLYRSNPEVEKVRIYLVGEVGHDWSFGDSPIRADTVPDIDAPGPWGHYWRNNKIRLCRSDADQIVYLETDTFVLGALEEIYDGFDADLIARPGVEVYLGIHDSDKWNATLAAVGAPSYPYYSPGFMVFQNGSHKRIEQSRHEIIDRILLNELPICASKHAEVYAFSIAAAAEGLPHRAMKDHHHRYTMIGESHEDDVVPHLGTMGFDRHYLPIEVELGLDIDESLSVDRPGMTGMHAAYTRVPNAIQRRLCRRRKEENFYY